ncbi:peptidase [Hirsutella rhossiliensis]|uniref:Peptidase M20 domain-containing protein 2 n=1 Tax=Hirsutella rhossiliensis TaxID=111463 RepID=A0A9P8MLC1_9HYPO|nr:peptidase family m20/M25/M40 domain-containing protein [Hirsutella rhossiliensis]KAH0958393.1 peptidase family m20/M25/M40 domain-containing protein [Hirsutella rhossiliensis]
MPETTASETFSVDLERARGLVSGRVDELSDALRHQISKVLHANPELCFKEFIAHDTLTSYLDKLDFVVERSAYGLETSFEASVGERGRQVVVCCEYDALPKIGHACGHNLIAVSSLAAFLAAAHAMSALKLPGRLRILGTPAEEGGGGKAVLIDKGAFNPPGDIAAAIMAHPMPQHALGPSGAGYSGLAGLLFLASHKFRVEFHGQTAHAAGEPWNGTNALDAAVAAYNNVAILRQQIRPDERIHTVIEEGGLAPNVIPDYTRMHWGVRAPSMRRSEKLFERVKKCIEAAALATGCTHNITMFPTYLNLRANDTLCKTYVEEMAQVGEKVQLHQDKPYTASTDMGNVSHTVPSFHGTFNLPTVPDVAIHSPRFAEAAATDGAHAAAMKCAKGMAMLALRVLADGGVADGSRRDFQQPDELD